MKGTRLLIDKSDSDYMVFIVVAQAYCYDAYYNLNYIET